MRNGNDSKLLGIDKAKNSDVLNKNTLGVRSERPSRPIRSMKDVLSKNVWLKGFGGISKQYLAS